MPGFPRETFNSPGYHLQRDCGAHTIELRIAERDGIPDCGGGKLARGEPAICGCSPRGGPSE